MSYYAFLRRVTRRQVSLAAAVVFTLIVVTVTFGTVLGPKSGPASTSANSVKAEVSSTEEEVPVLDSVKSREALAKVAYNESLGFGEIVYISMPYRSDRQDALKIISAYTKIKMKLIPGVDGSKMNAKEWPDNTNKGFKASWLGCWRAHANAWQYMLDSNLETMLILEDDIDWDKNVHEVFERLSYEMQANPLRLDPPSKREMEAAPYGLDWDVLMLGQCKDISNPQRLDLAYSFNDRNAPSESKIDPRFAKQMRQLLGHNDISGKRIISPTYQSVCTMGYAITRLGAIRLLTELSYLGLRQAVDTEISNKMMEGKLRGYTITPPIVNAWRVNGWKDTDIQTRRFYKNIHGTGNKGGFSKNLKQSARLQVLEEIKQDNWERYRAQIPPSSQKDWAAKTEKNADKTDKKADSKPSASA